METGPVVLEGHTLDVYCVVYSPNGCWTASGSSDKTIIVREFGSGHVVFTVEHGGPVRSVVFSADSKRLLSGSWANTARVWDVATGKCLSELKHPMGVWSVAWSPDDTFFLTACSDKVRQWDAATYECLHTLDGHTDGVNSLAISPDSSFFVSGGDDKIAIVWEVRPGEAPREARQLEGQDGTVCGVAVSPDNSRIASALEVGKVKMWSVAGNELWSVGVGGIAFGAAFSPGGRLLATAVANVTRTVAPDGTKRFLPSFVVILDVGTGEEVYRLEGGLDLERYPPPSVKTVAYHPLGHTLLSGSSEGTCCKWVLPPSLVDNALAHDSSHTPRVILIGVGPHARYVYLPFLCDFEIQPVCCVDAYVSTSSQDYVSGEQQASRVRVRVEEELLPFGFGTATIVVVPLSDSWDSEIPRESAQTLASFHPSHIIISSGELSHATWLAAIATYLPASVAVLCDKPVVAVPRCGLSQVSAEMLKSSFSALVEPSLGRKWYVMCQRRASPAYQYLKSVISDISDRFGVPVTFAEAYHCDGSWIYPWEAKTLTSHTWQGYGKLLYSGYHIIDIVWDTLHTSLTKAKRCPKVVQYKTEAVPLGGMAYQCDPQFLEKTFPLQPVPTTLEFPQDCGEADVFSTMVVESDMGVESVVRFNLLSTGLSMRQSLECPRSDQLGYYKGTGRIRQETVRFNLGPLASIVYADDGDSLKVSVYRNSTLVDLGDEIPLHRYFPLERHSERARASIVRDFLSDALDSIHRLETQNGTISHISHIYSSIISKSPIQVTYPPSCTSVLL